MKKNVIFLLVYLVPLFFSISCQTEREPHPPETEPLYMARPKILIESPVAHLPLILEWESVNGAQSYEIETADSPQFNSSLKNWTTMETAFRIETIDSEELYFRIRSRFAEGNSRWSETLLIRDEGEDISLQWNR